MASWARVMLRSSARTGRISKSLVTSRRWVAQAVTYNDALNAQETNISTLPNKLRVATEENASSTATVGVWINAGSRFETEKNNGVSHLLEHLAFKGTSKRSQLDLELEAETNGIQLNASSSQEVTAIFAKCLSKDVPKAVEIIADIIQGRVSSDADVDKQRAVVLKELEEAESNLTTVVLDYLHATAYQGTPLSQSVLGTTQSLKSLTRKEVTEFVGALYKPQRMVLAAAGGVEHGQLAQLGEKYFGSVSLGQETPSLSRCRFTGSEIRARYDDLPLAHIALAIEGPGFNNPDSLALAVAQMVIGSWDRTYGAGANLSSRLASRCAQEEMCHSFQSFYSRYADTSLWGTYFVSDRMTIEDMLYNVQGEWMRLCSSIPESEVQRAKNQLKLALLAQRSCTTSTCDTIAKQVLYNGQVTLLAELDAQLNRITAKTVRNVCMEYIYDKCPALASIGPVENLPDYNRIRGAMYWLRL